MSSSPRWVRPIAARICLLLVLLHGFINLTHEWRPENSMVMANVVPFKNVGRVPGGTGSGQRPPPAAGPANCWVIHRLLIIDATAG